MNTINEEDDSSQNWTNLITYPASSTGDLSTRLGRTNLVVHNFNFYLAKNTRSLESLARTKEPIGEQLSY